MSVLLRINRKKRCANCFCEIKSEPCTNCGYSKNTAAPDAETLPRRTKLAEKYIVGGVIGCGGFGKTYLALDTKSDKTLAIKEYFPPNIAVRERKTHRVKPISEKKNSVFSNGLERFSEEAEQVSRFNGNPNIVNIFECFRENGTAYCVMEFLSGITLEKYVENHGAASVEQCVYLAEKLAAALVAIHSAGMVHRDIAPDNIMLCFDGKIKLLDFGAARKPSEETSLTVMMKTGFTPVEQYSDGADLTAKTDIYALGMTLFYALTGKKPKSVFARMENDRDFSESLWAVTPNFKDIIKKAAAINSAERFESAAEFLNALSDTKIRGEGFSFSSEEFSPQNTLKVAKEIRSPKTRYFLCGLCAGGLLCGAALTPVIILNKPRVESSLTQQEQSSTISSQAQQNESSVTPVLPYTMEFGEFEGSFSSQYVGKISKNTLKSFGGDVKITLDIETVADFVNFPEIYLIYPVDDGGANMISACAAFDEQCAADVSGAVEIEKDARQFSFVLTAEGIEKLNGGFGFETYHVAIRSVTLEPVDGEYSSIKLKNCDLPENSSANYSVSTGIGGRATVSAALEQYLVTDWGGSMTNYIPSSAFDCFSGDVKLTFQIEYSPRLPEEDNQYQVLYMNTIGSLGHRVFEFAETVQVYDENGSPLITRTDNLGVFPALECTECSVILPQNIVEKICGGLGFTGDNMIIKSVVIENA